MKFNETTKGNTHYFAERRTLVNGKELFCVIHRDANNRTSHVSTHMSKEFAIQEANRLEGEMIDTREIL